MSGKQLKMTFQPTVIEHFGVKMYSHTVPAIAELIANAYDAGAKVAEVLLYDKHEHKIIIRDDGIGMTFDEINEFYLRIGRNRREENQISCPNRKATGKKGLGKLALFGLGNKIEISTVRNGEQVTFILNYEDIKKSKGDYEPEFNIQEADFSVPSGTTITLTELTKKQGYPLNNYVEHLARLFDFPDPSFIIKMSLNDEEPRIIDSKLKYSFVTSQFEWDYAAFIQTDSLTEKAEKYSNSGLISGKFITTEKPLKNGLKGITLFANGRMVNEPEFFRSSESSHFYSYLTGWLNVDFIDDDNEDLISTDRRSLDWKQPITTMLQNFLGEVITALERDWRKKRKETKERKIKDNTTIDLSSWKDKLPPEIKQPITEILEHVIENSELAIAQQEEIVEALHGLIPEYPYYHWRGLHSQIQDASRKYYEQEDYYQAFSESIKRYIANTREKSKSTQSSEQGLMGEAFGARKENRILTVTKKHALKPNGRPFTENTLASIEDGQKFLSMGIVSGYRNPIAHEEIKDLKSSNLFTEKDCLDALGLLSHLQRRLDDSELE
ncbi:TIGR02391 family protein [Actinobacillus pleuropneumoniae]|uniref:TIGR02391 family protein n=1 Tax=Actinobacillus pleuropneumoniae TaxID=715 RepID=UPI002EB2B7ED|nr:TIGR02391 family protein [Actinobacillus pleuropneumoniae]